MHSFFEAPNQSFNFIKQHDFDLHIALEVSYETLLKMYDKGKIKNIETRGISDHGFISSVYFRDPNGYVVELAAKKETYTDQSKDYNQSARSTLAEWSNRKFSKD